MVIAAVSPFLAKVRSSFRLSPLLAVAAIFGALVAAASGADSAHERDLKQLLDQRDKALAIASASPAARFKSAAELLLRRTLQAGDIDTSNIIKKAVSEPLSHPSINNPKSRPDTAGERDLRQLVEQRNQALETATLPVLTRFKSDADKLLRRATQAGDLEAANKIKEAMTKTVSLVPRSSLNDLKNLAGTTWMAVPNTGVRPGLADTLTFSESGVQPGGYKYEVENHNTMVIIFPRGDRQPLTLAPNGKQLKLTFQKAERVYELTPQ